MTVATLTRSQAWSYLARVTAEHFGTLLFAFGWLLGAAGASSVVPVLAFGGLAMLVAAILSGAIAGFRRREPGMPMFGHPSIQDESNRLTGWWYLPEACELVGGDARAVRRLWMGMAVGTVALFVVGIAVGIARA